MLRADRTATLARIRSEGRAMPFGVPGAGEHVLVVVPAPAGDLRPRLAVAARRWSLTRRELDVLALVAEGRTNAAIAKTLRISEKTVEVRVTSLLRKSGSSSRAQLVARVWAAMP
jgi:DNA-binding CsgD family transcriptional regulator